MPSSSEYINFLKNVEKIPANINILNIATKYGFSNHDTFTRAFKRITGLTPIEFKEKRPAVGRIKLCAGVYGIGLLNQVKREDDGS